MNAALPEIAYAPARQGLLVLVFVCLGSFAVIALGIFWGWQTGRLGVLSTVVLGGCAGVLLYVGGGCLRQVFEPVGLVIDADGFSYRYLMRRKRIAWLEVSEFRAVTYPSIIAFELAGAPDNLARRWHRTTIGASDCIVAHAFSLPLEHVCATLNENRGRALASSNLSTQAPSA